MQIGHSGAGGLSGAPTEIVALPVKRSRSWAEDHFWQSYVKEPPPVHDVVTRLEVYTYPLDGGGLRRVYLGYYERADELVLLGYDHAQEQWARNRSARAVDQQP